MATYKKRNVYAQYQNISARAACLRSIKSFCTTTYKACQDDHPKLDMGYMELQGVRGFPGVLSPNSGGCGVTKWWRVSSFHGGTCSRRKMKKKTKKYNNTKSSQNTKKKKYVKIGDFAPLDVCLEGIWKGVSLSGMQSPIYVFFPILIG